MRLLDRRLIAVLGVLAALGLAAAAGLVISGRRPQAPANTGELRVEAGADTDAQPTKPLRCFVGGRFVGSMTLAACAARGGVSAQALDAGLDPQTGAAPGGSLAPPPPAPLPVPAPQEPAAAPAAPAEEADANAGPGVPGAACLRYSGDAWRTVSGNATLQQCARALFEGRCVRPGEALYGRFGGDTLRLVPGRVEMSPDNRSFHLLYAQSPEECAPPPG